MGQAQIDGYLKWGMHRVAGYLGTLDARLFNVLLMSQTARGIDGSLVEIGVHHGRSFFLMAMHRQGAERSLAIDLFEDDEIYTDPKGLGRIGNFHRNRERLGITLSNEEVLKGSSLELDSATILARVEPARFFSIDGGHRYEHVENDLRLSKDTISEEGVIVVDDFSSPVWPEVTFATHDWLKGDGKDFAPFAVSQAKLYLCNRDQSHLYRQAVASDPTLESNCGQSASFLGDEALFLRQARGTKARDLLLRKLLAIERSAP